MAVTYLPDRFSQVGEVTLSEGEVASSVCPADDSGNASGYAAATADPYHQDP